MHKVAWQAAVICLREPVIRMDTGSAFRVVKDCEGTRQRAAQTIPKGLAGWNSSAFGERVPEHAEIGGDNL